MNYRATPTFHGACATVLETIAAAAERGAPCPSNAELAIAAGLGSVTGVSRALGELEARGMITIQQRGNRRRVTVLAIDKTTAAIDGARLTGEDLANQVIAAAKAAGRTVADYGRPLSADPVSYLKQLALAREPRAPTIARINALLAGERVSPVPAKTLRRRVASSASGTPGSPDPASPFTFVNRDPCGRCGARGDYACGCRPPVARFPYRADPSITLAGVGSALL